jgi:hypothetical protein
MNKDRLVHALSTLVSNSLSQDLVDGFVAIRQDFATKTLERAAPGKFVETLVQCLQQMVNGTYAAKPDVDAFLRAVESQQGLEEGLRICTARIARAVYTLRNKRNIAHKGSVDPNSCDLAFINQAAAWIMAELLRCASGVTMEEAGSLIELVQAPVGSLVEEIDGIRMVHAEVSARCELLLLLHSFYPDRVQLAGIVKSMRARSPASVRNRLGEMRNEKLVYGDPKSGFRLTQAGHAAAVREVNRLFAA